MIFLSLIAALQIGGAATPPPQAQKLFESGKYEELIQLVAAAPSPSDWERYLAGQADLKLEPPNPDEARQAFGQLGGDDEDVWTFVGGSAGALVDHDADAAIAAAGQAVKLNPDSFIANYQLGLAYAEKKNWADAVRVFEKAATIDPGFAYAHYYAGTANYQIKRTDRMANAFERFIKLAPQAPERPAVETLLRTIRGR